MSKVILIQCTDSKRDEAAMAINLYDESNLFCKMRSYAQATGRPVERLKAVRELREAVGDGVWLHGFGWGVKGIANAIRNEPSLLDSIDYSTPMQDADMAGSAGKERMSVVAMEAAQQLIHDLREVSEYPDKTATQQVTL